MLINKARLDAVFTEMNNAFAAGATNGKPQWQKIAMKVPSAGARNAYHWLANWPRLRRWIGAKQVKNLSGEGFEVVNEDFESTVAIPRNDMEDGQEMMYVALVRQSGQSAAEMPDDLVFEVVNNAFTAPCYDGRPLIDDAHPVGEGTQSNKGTMALSADSLATADASLGVARANLRKRADPEGRPLNIIPTLLLVGPDLENVGRSLLMVDKFADGTPNPYFGSMELMVSNLLESPTAWFVIDNTKEVKPFVFQPRKAPELVQVIADEAVSVFMQNEYLYGVEARAAAAYGYWQLVFGSTGQ